MKRLRIDWLAPLAYCAFLTSIFIIPLGILAARSLTGADGGFSLANYREYLRSPELFSSLRNTAYLGVGTVALTLPLAFLFAYGLERCRLPLRGVFFIIGSVPLLAPSLLPAIALVYLFGHQGLFMSFLGGQLDLWLLGTSARGDDRDLPARTRHLAYGAVGGRRTAL